MQRRVCGASGWRDRSPGLMQEVKEEKSGEVGKESNRKKGRRRVSEREEKARRAALARRKSQRSNPEALLTRCPPGSSLPSPWGGEGSSDSPQEAWGQLVESGSAPRHPLPHSLRAGGVFIHGSRLDAHGNGHDPIELLLEALAGWRSGWEHRTAALAG